MNDKQILDSNKRSMHEAPHTRKHKSDKWINIENLNFGIWICSKNTWIESLSVHEFAVNFLPFDVITNLNEADIHSLIYVHTERICVLHVEWVPGCMNGAGAGAAFIADAA